MLNIDVMHDIPHANDLQGRKACFDNFTNRVINALIIIASESSIQDILTCIPN